MGVFRLLVFVALDFGGGVAVGGVILAFLDGDSATVATAASSDFRALEGVILGGFALVAGFGSISDSFLFFDGVGLAAFDDFAALRDLVVAGFFFGGIRGAGVVGSGVTGFACSRRGRHCGRFTVCRYFR